ncbi:uncharacterized protein DEA37_0009235 [Paragonimus westermani]|uniref:Uncharacterized protein n=1 Tax=Paragonimus westermani TaxID=34504 RepID=A0A5J4NMN5_9TREM|nr:uncharacterized protein DEA37_0009235 [Paragonimus westermani]
MVSPNPRVPSLARRATQMEEERENYLDKQTKNYAKLYHNSRWGIWMDFAETTTLHGPIHITSTSGKLRLYYILVVTFMAGMFMAHASYLFVQYLSFPVLTEIKYGNIDFDYPDITLCPNSPFTEANIPEGSGLKDLLESSEKFWFDTNQVNFGSPKSHQKRSMLSAFYKWSATMGKKPYQHILECQVKKQECLDNFIITEHPIYYRCFTLRIKTQPPVPAGPTNGIRLILYRGQVNATPLLLVAEDEPFILQSVNSTDAYKAKDGYFIAFHEKNTFPNFPVQSLPNGLSVRFGESMRIGLEQTDYQAVNLTGRMCINGDFAPNIELLRLDKLSESNAKPHEVERGMAKFNYTRQACVAIHRQLLIYRTCKCFSEYYAIPYSMRDIGEVWCHNLDTSTTNIIQIGTTLECVEGIANMTDDAVDRLSKSVRYSFHDRSQIFLLDISNLLAEHKLGTQRSTPQFIANPFVYHVLQVHVLAAIEPNTEGDGLADCPLRCNRRMISIHSSLQTNLVQQVEPKSLIPYFEMLHLKHLEDPKDRFVNEGDPPIQPKDLIFLDIHPVSEMVNQVTCPWKELAWTKLSRIIENPGYTFTKFISDLGGISGLYVGITMYTLAELADLITQFLCIYLPYMWSSTKLELTKQKNMAARLERRLAEEAVLMVEQTDSTLTRGNPLETVDSFTYLVALSRQPDEISARIA